MKAFFVFCAAILLVVPSHGQGAINFHNPDPTGFQTPFAPSPPVGTPPPTFEISSLVREGSNLRFLINARGQAFTNYILEASNNLHTWNPILNNSTDVTSFTIPFDTAAAPLHFRLRSPYQFGTVIFYNRNFSTPNAQGQVNVPVPDFGNPEASRAQLYLVTGAAGSEVYTPLKPLQRFRTALGQEGYFVGPVTVEVIGQPPGTSGLQFVVRAWEGAATYETATSRGQSGWFTVSGPLGGTDSQGNTFFSPDLGGPNGWDSWTLWSL